MALSQGINWCIRTDGSDTICGGGSRAGAILATPSAPTVVGSGSGGTVAAGTYYCVLVFVDMYGETKYSAQTPVTLAGATSSFTVTGPARPAGGYTWALYVGTVSGGPYFQESANLTFGINRVVTVTPPTSGTQPPGTNYTNQATAQIAYTDLVIDGATNTKMTSAAHPFTSDHVGSIIRITAGTGFTVQFVEVMGVDASNVATVDKSLGTLGSTGGTGYLGGAFATPTFLVSFGGGGSGPVMVDQNFVHIKSATYQIATAINNYVDCYWTGFGTARGDGGTKPIIQANANSFDMFVLGTNGGAWIENITFDGNNKISIRGWVMAAPHVATRKCKWMNFTNGAIRDVSATACVIEQCEFSGCSSVTVVVISQFDVIRECYFHDCTVTAIRPENASVAWSIMHCILDTITGASSDGISCDFSAGSGTADIINCSFYNIGRNGIVCNNVDTRHTRLAIDNCIFEGCVTAISTSGNTFIDECAFYNNTTDYSPTIGMWVRTVVILSGSPFVDAANGNFALNNTAGAGKLCRGAGILGVFPGALSTGGMDIGAVQTAAQTVTGFGYGGSS